MPNLKGTAIFFVEIRNVEQQNIEIQTADIPNLLNLPKTSLAQPDLKILLSM
jgi:hypothetical protein